MARTKVRICWTALAILILAALADAAVKRTRKRVVCYYTNWSVYRQGLAKYQPANINPHLCTHLIYAFGTFNDGFELEPSDKYQDIEKGGYARFNGLKQYNRGLRTLLALGGWNEGSGRFSELVAEPEYRKTFILSVIRYLRQYNFDGLDLDWEYPGSRAGSTYEDKDNYATLCEELRAAFDVESVLTNRPALLLTVAVPAGTKTIEKGFNVPRLNAAVDFFNILAYDYHAVTEPLTDHHAPLLPAPDTFGSFGPGPSVELNVDYTVRFYLKLGAERRKLVVGIPTYGRSFTLIDERFNGLQAASSGAGTKGKHTNENGYLSFYEICEHVAVDEWSVYRPHPDAMGPYATKGQQWVGYDDETAVKTKAEYVRDNHLGGIMFWSIDNDDFRGRCSGRPYPLIEAAKEAYLAPAPGDAPKQAPAPTPVPPATPDPGAGFTCKREGFFPHPSECNKYFWCLAGGPLGITSHSFTCPAGLLFNRRTDACDFPRNVKCKVEVKEVTSITFPPTREPTVLPPGPLETTGDVTPDPFDQYYEDYDTEDLEPFGLEPIGTTETQTPVEAPKQVLGGSRGGQVVERQPQEQESDPEELKKLLQLITDLGGVEAVQKILEEDETTSGGSAISEQDRQTLIRIVGKSTTTAAPSTRPDKERTSDRDSSFSPSVSEGRRPQTQRTRLHLSRRRQRPQSTAESAAGVAPERERTNSRRRQYSSIQRDRTDTTTAEPTSVDGTTDAASSPGRRQYIILRRQRPTGATSAESEGEDTPQTGRRQYVTLQRSEPTAATSTQPTTSTEETSTTQPTKPVETEPAVAAVSPSEEDAGRPRGTVTLLSPSDPAEVESLLDLTDDAVNSLDTEPRQRRIRIRLRRPGERTRSSTKKAEAVAEEEAATATTEAVTEAPEVVTSATTEETAEEVTIAPIEIPSGVSEELLAEEVTDIPIEEQGDSVTSEETLESDNNGRKIRVIRVKRPRERTTQPTTEATSEILENEVTVDSLSVAETTAQSDVAEAAGSSPTAEIGSVRIDAETELSSPKTDDAGAGDRDNALAGNAILFEEGIRGRALEEKANTDTSQEETEFIDRNTLRRLGTRRQGLVRARTAQSVDEDQEKNLSDNVRSRPRIGVRRQRVRPVSAGNVKEIEPTADRQSSAGKGVSERGPLRGIRLINLRNRGPVLRGRSRDGLTSSSSTETTQISTDVQTATETSDVIPPIDENTAEQPDVSQVTVTEKVTVLEPSTNLAEETTESLASPEAAERTVASDDTKPAVDDKGATQSIRQPPRRGLFRRLQNPVDGSETSDGDSQSSDRTLRRLRIGGDRNVIGGGTIRRRFRQRGGLGRRRPGRPILTSATEEPEADKDASTESSASSPPSLETGEGLTENGELPLSPTEPGTTSNSLQTTTETDIDAAATTESGLLNGNADITTTPVYPEDLTTTVSTEEATETSTDSVDVTVPIETDNAFTESNENKSEEGLQSLATPPTGQEDGSLVPTPTDPVETTTMTTTKEDLIIDDNTGNREETDNVSDRKVTGLRRRPPVRGLFRLRQTGEDSVAEPDNRISRPASSQRDRPRVGLRNRLRSQQRTDQTAVLPEKQGELDRPTAAREGLLSQPSLGSDAERAVDGEGLFDESFTSAQENLLRRVRPSGDGAIVREQLTQLDETGKAKTNAGDTETGSAPLDEKLQANAEIDTLTSDATTTALPIEESFGENPVTESNEDNIEPVTTERYEDIDLPHQDASTEPSETPTSIINPSEETTSGTAPEESLETTTEEITQRPTPERNTLSIADRLAILRSSIGNRNSAPSSTASPSPKTSAAAVPSVSTTTESIEESPVERLQRLRQSFLANARERPDPLAALRRRTNGPRPLQRPSSPTPNEEDGEASSPAAPVDVTISSLESGEAPKPEIETEPSLQKSTEESPADKTDGSIDTPVNNDAPFRRKFGGPRQRPFPIRPSSQRRSSLGSRLRERLAATVGLPASPGAEEDEKETVDAATANKDELVAPDVVWSPTPSSFIDEETNTSPNDSEGAGAASASAETVSSTTRRPPFRPSFRSSSSTDIAALLKDRLSLRPNIRQSEQATVAATATTTERPIFGENAANTNSEAGKDTASPSLSLFRQRPSAAGGLRSLRQRLAGLSSRQNVDPTQTPSPETTFDFDNEKQENAIIADSTTEINEQLSENTAGDVQEITTESNEEEQTTAVPNDGQDETLLTPSLSSLPDNEEITPFPVESASSSVTEGLRNSFESHGVLINKETNGLFVNDLTGTPDPEADELELQTTTERTASTRRSALLRFSSRSRKPATTFTGTLPSSVENERSRSDLAAKLASQSNTESPFSALRNRLRERLAASIGLGSSSAIKTQSETNPSDSHDEPTPVGFSPVAASTTEDQADISTTELPEEATTLPEERTTINIETTAADVSSTTEINVLDSENYGTTNGYVTEVDSASTTERDVLDSESDSPNNETPSSTIATIVTTSTTTPRPRKLSLVEQLRQRQEQKKSSVLSLVEQLRSSLFGSQQEKEAETDKTTTTVAPIEDRTQEPVRAVSEGQPIETTTLSFEEIYTASTPVEETTTAIPLDTTTLSTTESYADNASSSTDRPFNTDTSTALVQAEDETESSFQPELSPEHSWSTTKRPLNDGVVYAVAIDPATYFASTTEATNQVLSTPWPTESQSSGIEFYEEGIVYATTLQDSGSTPQTTNVSEQTESTTASADEGENLFTSTEQSGTIGKTENEDVAGLTEAAAGLFSTSQNQEAASESEAGTTISSQEEIDVSGRSTTLPPGTRLNASSSRDTYDGTSSEASLPADSEAALLFTGGREGRLLKFENLPVDTERPIVPPTVAPGLVPTGNPGSFVSVKVSVSSSVEESPGHTESIQVAVPTEQPATTTGLPTTVGTLVADDLEPTTTTPAATEGEEVEDDWFEPTEPSEVTEESLPSFTDASRLDASEGPTTASPVDGSLADHALDRPREASLVHALQKSTPPEPKPTLFNSQGLLAYSTVTPRYRDPDSLFKRKTYLSGGGSHQSPVTWMIGVFSLLLLWSHL